MSAWNRCDYSDSVRKLLVFVIEAFDNNSRNMIDVIKELNHRYKIEISKLDTGADWQILSWDAAL